MSRHRERSSVNSKGTMTHSYACGPSAGSVTSVLSSSFESIDDVVTPNFRSRIANGEVIMNDCNKLRQIEDSTGGGNYFASLPGGSCPSVISGDGSLTYFCRSIWGDPGYMTLSLDSSSSLSASRTNALAGIDKTPYSFAEDLLEFRETLSLLVSNSLSNLLKLATSYEARKNAGLALLRLRRASPLEISQFLSNLYLEYQFGFRPLVQSAYQLIDSFAKKVPQRPPLLVSHGKGFEVKGSNDDLVSNLAFKFQRHVEASINTRSTVIYKVSNPFDDSWRFKYGLRNKDLLVGLWEVFPLSFMIDRLINIKASIKAAENLIDPDVKILGACSVIEVKATRSISMVEQTNPGAYQVSISPDVDRFITESYSRTGWGPSASDLIPVFQPFNLINSISKVADLISLIVQRLK